MFLGLGLGLQRGCAALPGLYVPKAITADGSNDYLELDAPTFLSNAKQGHLSFFVKPAVTKDLNVLWAGTKATGAGPFIELANTLFDARIKYSGGGIFDLSVQVSKSGGIALETMFNAFIVLGNWNFYAVSWDIENDLYSYAVSNGFTSGVMSGSFDSADPRVLVYDNAAPIVASSNLTRALAGNPSDSSTPYFDGDCSNIAFGQSYVDWTNAAKQQEYVVHNQGAAPAPVNPSLYTEGKIIQLTSNAVNYGTNDAGTDFTIIGSFIDTTPPGA